MDLHDVLDFLLAAARSVGAEVTSPWFYLQLGLIMAGAGIAFAARRRDAFPDRPHRRAWVGRRRSG